MEFPVALALAQAVQTLPTAPGLWYEPKADGHRVALWREEDGVRLQARSGRDVTDVWSDLARAGMQLEPGTILDGEAVVYRDGKIDFSAAQARAASSPTRARLLARQLPASYAVWDILAHAELGDVRMRPYVERRALLLEVLEDVGPPIQALPTTPDPKTALLWYEALQDQGVEGLVIKPGASVYRTTGRVWQKLRHAETVDVPVVGYTGPPARPRAIVVQLPDGRIALSQALTAPVAAQVAAYLMAAGPPGRARTDAGDPYRTAPAGLLVEALAGTTRHAVVTVTRVR
ncbi:ATP-dependent DNA ligase [Streptomyces sp. NBC_01304]|uniref:ATP-dependent DNA ligase n=1 Tax=Streptomyces sp. NBC_01304 TaxID=2903818 RepID=UPI002E15B031|nr:DNA ligase [Streptomyces sp. NBC_01304]